MKKGKTDSTIILIGLIILVLFLAKQSNLFSFYTLEEIPPTIGALPKEMVGNIQETISPRCSPLSSVWYSDGMPLGFGDATLYSNSIGMGYTWQVLDLTTQIYKNNDLISTVDNNFGFENDEIKLEVNNRKATFKKDTVNNFGCTVNNYIVNSSSTITCSFNLTRSRDDLYALAFSATEIPGTRFTDFKDYRTTYGTFNEGTHEITFNLPVEKEPLNKRFFIALTSSKPATHETFAAHQGQGFDCPVSVYPELTLMQNYRYSVTFAEQQPSQPSQPSQPQNQSQTQQQTQNQTQQAQGTSGGSSGSSGSSQVTIPTSTITSLQKINPLYFLGIIAIVIAIIFIIIKRK